MLLTPLYLSLIFYKLSTGADFEGLFMVSVTILVLYLPMQLIIKQNELPLSHDVIFSYQEILNLLYPVFALIGMVTIYTVAQSFKIDDKILVGIILATYAIWWWLTENLFQIVEKGDEEVQVKMVGMLLFVIALALMDHFPKLPSQIDLWYALELLITIFYVIVMTLFLLPRYGLKVIKFLAKDALRAANPLSNKKERKQSRSVENDIESVLNVLIMAIFFFVLILVPLINWIASITDGWDPQVIAVIMTLFMIILSAFGAYFQLRIFISYFIKEINTAKKLANISLGLFYLATIVNMGFMETITESTQHLESTQKSIHEFNKKVQKLDHDITGR